MPERLMRWIVISLLTGCRPEAALDLSPEARRSGAPLIDLNPTGRVQNKKYRPTVRVPRTLRAFLNTWEKSGLDAFGGRYCGYTTVEGVKTALERIRSDDHVKLPQVSTYSFRHKVATILRSARKPGRVPEDQIAVQMGHKRKDLRSTTGYGEWDPDYLKEASHALDAWFLRLRRELISQDSPKFVTTRTDQAA
jgi:integrase